jgi:MYXO-CTERM domain-containing protein
MTANTRHVVPCLMQVLRKGAGTRRVFTVGTIGRRKRENMSILNRLGRHVFAASAVAITTAGTAHAAVERWDCNLSIPATSAGLFINIQSRVTGTNGASVLGWDFNLYTTSPSAPSLTMFGNIGTRFMRAPGQFGYAVGNLQEGQEVGFAQSQPPQSLFNPEGEAYSAIFNTPGQPGFGNWNLNSINYFGFRFAANTGAIHYGNGRMDVGANANVRTLKFIEWNTTPGAGMPVIPAPGALALLGLAGFGRSRRRH